MRTSPRTHATLLAALLTSVPAAAQITEIVDAAGAGPGAPLDKPAGIGVDASGNVFVSGASSNNVLMIAPGGAITEILDAAGDGAGNGLGNARGITVGPDGSVFVSGWTSNNVFMIENPGQPAQSVQMILDASGDGIHAIGRPSDMVSDALGNVFVAGIDSDNVFMIQSPGTPAQVTNQILGPSGDGAGHPLDAPAGLAMNSSGDLLVASSNSDVVFLVSSPGLPSQAVKAVLTSAGDGLGNALDLPRGIAVDGIGNLYVAGVESDNVFRVTDPGLPTQSITQLIDATGAGTGSALDGADYVAVDGQGTVYVTGVNSDNAFQVASPSLNPVITEIIDAGGDGLGNPLDVAATVAVRGSGDVFVVGQGSDNVFRIQVPPPSFVPYGSGCAGTGGVVPVLAMSGAATPGGSVQLDILNGVGSGSAYVVLGLHQAALPMGFGCTLNVAPLLPAIIGPVPLFPLGAQGPGAGSISVPATLPDSLTPPVTLTVQTFIVDPGAAGGFANTNGVEMLVD